ncbi:MAG: hypothetical protein JNL02_18565 [Saprospiraceae bacterium]|nr:hypothetical protein [Saprospiraceae bacterium]
MENNKELPDLDHLKAAWNQDLLRQSDSAEFINRQNLLAMMQQRTHSAISRLKRNLMIEIVSTAFMLAALFGYTLWVARPVPWYAWLAIILITFTGHVVLYQSLRRQDRMLESKLIEALETSIRHTGRFVRAGKQMAWIVAIIILLAMGNQILAMEEKGQNVGQDLFLTALAAFTAYFLVNFYVENLYGKYYKNLLACREELNQE